MTYRNGFVAVIMKDGRPVRETSGTVILPFGSEYEILLKNKTNRRARADIFIDGAAANDSSYILEANSDTVIKRFCLDGNMDSGAAFKFVKKEEAEKEVDTSGKDFGVVEVRFTNEIDTFWYDSLMHSPNMFKGRRSPSDASNPCGEFYSSRHIACNIGGEQVFSASTVNDGGTVQGKEVQQGFTTATWHGDLKGSTTTVRIKLKGPAKESLATRLTGYFASYCSNCGTQARSEANYCTKCGTKLT